MSNSNNTQMWLAKLMQKTASTLKGKFQGGIAGGSRSNVLATGAALLTLFFILVCFLSPSHHHGFSRTLKPEEAIREIQQSGMKTESEILSEYVREKMASGDSKANGSSVDVLSTSIVGDVPPVQDGLTRESGSGAEKPASGLEVEGSEQAPKDQTPSDSTAQPIGSTADQDSPSAAVTSPSASVTEEGAPASSDSATAPAKASSEPSAATPAASDSASEDSSANAQDTADPAASEAPAQPAEQKAPSPIAVPTYPLCPPHMKDDHIPCLDNLKAIKKLHTTSHYEHRERHCPAVDEVLMCLLPLPEGYKQHIKWPQSRDEIWYSNVPKPSLANYKRDQNWVKTDGDKFLFPGGGTQFKHGATRYIQWIQQVAPQVSWGDRVRVILDMGCGVASFAAYLEPYDVRCMSVAPKDEHDAQIQFALERGVSAMLGVMGTMRQPYPAGVFDAVHCARCRVPWHADGGRLLLELNRLIRPGGFFVWSATPVCLNCPAKEKDDKEIWEAMQTLTKALCWKRLAKEVNRQWGIGVAVWQKPKNNECYKSRGEEAQPPMCPKEANPDSAWYTPMNSCIHPLTTRKGVRGNKWPEFGKIRPYSAPTWLASLPSDTWDAVEAATGVVVKRSNGSVSKKSATEGFNNDMRVWEETVQEYLGETIMDWTTVRNVMDVNALLGGFSGALMTKPVWTMNVVPVGAPDTLPLIYDRSLLGVYHDWCEAFNTYPRSYDLLHVTRLFTGSILRDRCGPELVLLEMDRILRPLGYVILREARETVEEIRPFLTALHWETLYEKDKGDVIVLGLKKTMWRPPANDSSI